MTRCESPLEDIVATPVLPDAKARISALERRLAEDLELSGFPPEPWISAAETGAGDPIYDVVIQGAGMQGIALAHSLRRHLIPNVLLIDENDAGLEGPWLRYARMHYLRTPKVFVGPDMGLPSLSFRAWFVARHGEAAWRDVVNIPKLDWVAYLGWYRNATKLPVWNAARVELIEPITVGGSHLFRIEIRREGRLTAILARKVVRAVGILGTGGGRLPHHLIVNIPKDRYNHGADPIDFKQLRGRRVGVIGAGASAYDNSAACLEAGAFSVKMLMRRTKPSVKFENLISTVEWMKNYAELSDQDRWRLHDHLLKFSAPPPPYALKRVAKFDNFELKSGRGVDEVALSPKGHLDVRVGGEVSEFDHLIFSTGFDVNLENVPELKPLRQDMMLWQDRRVGEFDHPHGRYPYLGSNFEYKERNIGSAPYLKNLYEFTPAATLSLGMISVGLNSLSFGVQRVVDGIVRDFFLGDLSDRIDKLLSIDPQGSIETDKRASIASLR